MRLSIDFMRGAVLTIVLVSLAGCSEYLVRRDSISPFGGNTVEGDKVVQMVDPWPRASANRNIAYNGIEMENAMERYKTGRVIPPKGTGTSTGYAAPASPQGNNTTPLGPTVNQPAAATP
jgi:hypothetical protein